MNKEYIFIASLAIVAAVLFGFGSRLGLALQNTIRGASLASVPGAADLTASLISGAVSAADAKTVPVYSQYPLNLKNELSIAAGGADGVAAGSAALVNGFLVGIVEKTTDHSSIVRTVFDDRFQMPVRIGAAGADALLRGGNDPTLTLIASGALVAEGDEIYSAASGLPYGLSIGVLRGLHDAGDKVFREASLVAPYNPGSVEKLTILPPSGQ